MAGKTAGKGGKPAQPVRAVHCTLKTVYCKYNSCRIEKRGNPWTYLKNDIRVIKKQAIKKEIPVPVCYARHTGTGGQQEWSRYKERKADALALGADERRDKLR